jgi:pyruvate dehydrogenase E2 component (dihydrolipoamide acetyltransferase)
VETAVAAPRTGNGTNSGKLNATPAARRAAREEAIDLGTVAGSGPKSRIQQSDVLNAAKSLQVAPVAEGDVVIVLEGIRRTIAERLTASYQSTPHISFAMRVDMTRFNEARQELNTHADSVDTAHISATAMFVKAVAVTLLRHPWLNASLRSEEIRLRKDINVGVAVALDTGLIVPVVKNADQKGIAQIAAEVNDLSARARSSQLLPTDVSDGTFTISNLGPFGVEQFTAIINPPQSAILAVGATQLEAIPDSTGEIKALPMMHMTLSADHRIVDGAVAARFVSDLRAALESPILLVW